MRYKDIVLDRVRTYRTRVIDADFVAARLSGKIKKGELMRLEHEDACEQRQWLECYGKRETWEVSCPTTWWEHLKLALKTRWPRLFYRLHVCRRTVMFDSGWVCPELRAQVEARHMVIPFVIGPNTYEDVIGPPEPERTE